ncbi:MAG: hypothetical protein R3F61_12760 [Myxococcota bacterium]
MGHGAPRELAGDDLPLKELSNEDAERLEAALQVFEQGDPSFKSSREDERHQQMSKAWNVRTGEIVEDLRQISKVIVASHQVLLDMSQDGAGVGATPWIEEGGLKFERMHIRLKNGPVHAEVGSHTVATAKNMKAVTYDWLEKAVVEWLIYVASKR